MTNTCTQVQTHRDSRATTYPHMHTPTHLHSYTYIPGSKSYISAILFVANNWAWEEDGGSQHDLCSIQQSYKWWLEGQSWDCSLSSFTLCYCFVITFNVTSLIERPSHMLLLKVTRLFHHTGTLNSGFRASLKVTSTRRARKVWPQMDKPDTSGGSADLVGRDYPH